MDELNSFDTHAVHAGEEPDPETGALRQPIHMSTTFKLPGFGSKLFEALFLEGDRPPYVYTRWSNPTLRGLEDRLAALEGAEACLVFGSGMGAISSLVFTVLKSGDHLVASEVCYAGSVEFFGEVLPKFGIEVSLVDTNNLPEVQAALKSNTKLLYAETPSNPVLRISDIAALSEIAHTSGIPLAVDSTFASPVCQQPLSLGADYVVHSLTKYINGHGDALGGAILGSEEDIQQIRKTMLILLGSALSPFNAWLINRGLTTLSLRVEKQSASAFKIAHFLENHPKVQRVFYPGLESHPHHALAKTQMTGYGGIVSFQLVDGLEAAINLAENIKLFQYATSLGHAHSLLFYYPVEIYVDAVSYLDQAQKASIREWTGEGIVRASIGLEDPDDLIHDLDQALTARTVKGKVVPLVYQLLKKYAG
jgi:methionine-gamma-lyase